VDGALRCGYTYLLTYLASVDRQYQESCVRKAGELVCNYHVEYDAELQVTRRRGISRSTRLHTLFIRCITATDCQSLYTADEKVQ